MIATWWPTAGGWATYAAARPRPRPRPRTHARGVFDLISEQASPTRVSVGVSTRPSLSRSGHDQGTMDMDSPGPEIGVRVS
jgi:hypothetical protein